MDTFTFVVRTALFPPYGAFLIYLWVLPTQVPQWAAYGGLRRVLLLDKSLEPTIFTLLMGLLFVGIVVYELPLALRGKAHHQR